jgi:tetratricopeptide (TPR) repeat protein
VVVLALKTRAPGGSIAKSTHRPPVWVIGLDGADWRYLDELMASGAMPELERLVRDGRRGVLNTEQPPLSPLLWTTMMTGVSPLEHRILDFARRRPGDGVPEPITSSERRVPAVWNMAAGARRKVVVLGLWATHPAEAVNGLMVADRFFSFLHPDEAPAGSVAPPERLPWAKERLRGAQAAADIVALRAYLPWLDERELQRETKGRDPYADPVSALRRILVETATYDALFRDAIAEIDPDLAILYLQGTDSVGHAFARYAPPALADVEPGDVARYGGVPEAYFRHVDELLGAYARLAQQRGARLLLVSDHGFRWGDDRPVGLSSSAHGTAAKWHRGEGIWLLSGPGVRQGNGAAGGVRQVCATILDLLGLPPGIGLAGPSLAVDALPRRVGPARTAVDYRRAFEPMNGEEAANAPTGDAGSASGDEALAALRALGYVAGDEPGAKRTAAAAKPSNGQAAPGDNVANSSAAAATFSTRTPASFDNEGLILRAEGRGDEARNAFEAALLLSPADPSAEWNLSDLLHDRPAERDRSDALLMQALAGGLAEGADALGNRVLDYAAAGDRTRAQHLLDAGLARMPREPRLWLLAGRLLLEREQCAPALRDFERATDLAPDRAEAFAAVGVARLCLGDSTGAAEALRRSLALDPNQPQLRSRLAELGG